jgi:ABC-type polysaccharide/polyol phosphate transport system ATPase subunit
MDPTIRVERLSKSYSLQAMERGSRTFGDTLVDFMKTPVRMLRGSARDGAGASPGRPGHGAIFWALKEVSFEVQPGEVVGIIGPNGAGKSTLFKILSRITRPTSGAVDINGRLGSLLEVGTGFHPELTGRENIFLNGAILGMGRKEIDRKFDEIVGFADIDQFLDMPVKRYSSGMYLRLAFAVAAFLEPEILLLDEVMAVGDREFQEKSARRIRYLTQQGITTLMISHNPAAIEHIVKRCLYIRSGQIVFDGKLSGALAMYYDHIHQEQKLKEQKAQALREQKQRAQASAEPKPADKGPVAKEQSNGKSASVPASAAPKPAAAAESRTAAATLETAAAPAETAPAVRVIPAAEPAPRTFETPKASVVGTPFTSVATLELAVNADQYKTAPVPLVQPVPEPEQPNAILSITAANASGDSELNQGEDLIITVKYRASPNLLQVRFQLSIWTEQGLMVTCADTRLMDQPESPVLEEGVAACVFPAVSLIHGRYLVKAIMFNPIMDWNPIAHFGQEGDKRLSRFVVKPKAEPLVTGGGWWPAHSDFGVVKLPFKWRAED